MAHPSPVAVDVEGATGQPPGPDVLVEHEVPSVQPSQRRVSFMDRRRQHVVVATPDGLDPDDRVIEGADDVVDDGIGHRGEDRLYVPVVLGPQAGVDQSVELVRRVSGGVQLRHHTTHDGAGR